MSLSSARVVNEPFDTKPPSGQIGAKVVSHSRC